MSSTTQEITPLFQLDGKVAILTGASKGIGAAMARGLAEFGAKVVISSRKQEAVDTVAEELKSQGLEAIGIACHVGEAAQLQQLVDKTIEAFGRIDIIINNAATNPIFATLDQSDPAVFDKIMHVNVRAPFLLCNYAYPHLCKQGGSIINISSVEGMKPSTGLGLYSSSKSALIALTQSQAKEWGKDGIRSNVICPGLIKTKFSAALWQNEAILKHIESQLPAARMGRPNEMAGLAVFLASDAASYCTGSVFTADGGYLIAG
ncbi:MAG: glucose 1-dehydrogenase [Bacteroidota bacterium]